MSAITNDNRRLCLDCAWSKDPQVEQELDQLQPGRHCKHYDPNYWVSQGFARNWGAAAVNCYPDLEILRKETEDQTEYIILSLVARRPVRLYVNKKTGDSWNSY